MRYYHRDREWIQQILDSQDKVSITTNVQAPLRSDIRVCDPKREKVLIDTALLVKSLEETKENVRCQSSSFCRVWLTLSGWLQTRVIGKSGRLQFRRSPFGRWLRWERGGELEETADEYDPSAGKTTTYRYHHHSTDHADYISTIREHLDEIKKEKPESKVRNELI